MADDGRWADPVTVPDDLRDLQHEVEAYHREQRLARRRQRWGAVTRGRTWRALSVPIGFALVLAVFSAGMVALMLLGQPAAQPAPQAVPVPSAGSAPLLPDVLVTRDGAATAARSLRPALLALVPLHCECTDVLSSLAAQADEFGLPLAVIAPAPTDAEVAALPGQLHRGRIEPVFDPTAQLARAFHAAGVTAVVVGPDATVGFVQTSVTADTSLELPLQRATTAASGR